MKGFIFTVDAVFALIVAMAAISILLFASYFPTYSNQSSTSEAYSIMQNLLGTTMGQYAQVSPLAAYASSSYTQVQCAWPQYGNNQSITSSTTCAGPSRPQILWQYQSPIAGDFLPSVVAADGLVVVASIGTNSQLWGFNATTGALVFNTFPNGVPVLNNNQASPVIYSHRVYTENALGYIYSVAENGVVLGKSSATGCVVNSILEQQGGFIQERLATFYPFNLTRNTFCSAPGSQSNSAYANGEFFLYGPSFASGSGAYNLNALTLSGSTIAFTWNAAIPTTNPTINNPPAASGNLVIVSGGTNLYAYTQGGSELWQKSMPTQVHGAVAIYNNTAYVQTESTIYALNASSGNQIWAINTPLTDQINSTPVATPSTVYVLSNGLLLTGINAQTGNLMWATAPYAQTGVFRRSFAEMAIAYGNIYYDTANILVAVGSTCKADPSASILQDLATMYLNGEGSCATAMLDQLYPSSHVAIYINNTFAPALSVAYYPVDAATLNTLVTGNANPVLPTGNQITLSAWVYPYTQTSSPLLNGIVGYGSRSCSAGSTAILAMQSTGLPSFTNWCNDFSPANGPVANFNQWNFIAAVLNGNYVTLYINGNSVGGYLPNSLVTVNVISKNFDIGVLGTPGGTVYRPFNGLISNVQIYGSSLTVSQMTQLYQEGLAGAPLTNSSADPVSWLPMEGDMNDYGPANEYNNMRWFTPPLVPTYIRSNYTPVTLLNSYQVSRASLPMGIKVDGVYRTYNVSVVVWR